MSSETKNISSCREIPNKDPINPSWGHNPSMNPLNQTQPAGASLKCCVFPENPNPEFWCPKCKAITFERVLDRANENHLRFERYRQWKADLQNCHLEAAQQGKCFDGGANEEELWEYETNIPRGCMWTSEDRSHWERGLSILKQKPQAQHNRQVRRTPAEGQTSGMAKQSNQAFDTRGAAKPQRLRLGCRVEPMTEDEIAALGMQGPNGDWDFEIHPWVWSPHMFYDAVTDRYHYIDGNDQSRTDTAMGSV